MGAHDSANRPLLGWREWVGLPTLGVARMKVKVDTGARTSSLHAWDVEHFERDGQPWVRFVLHPVQGETTTTVRAEAPSVGTRAVRSSNGQSEARPVIRADVTWGSHRWPIEITLTRRDAMGFRMLLGRQAVRGRFVVDPGRSFLGGEGAPTTEAQNR